VIVISGLSGDLGVQIDLGIGVGVSRPGVSGSAALVKVLGGSTQLRSRSTSSCSCRR